MSDADTKICPMCAETVKAAALRCRFCSYDFAGTPMPSPGRDTPTSPLHSVIDRWVDSRAAPKEPRKSLGCGGAAVIMIAALFLALYAVWPSDEEIAAKRHTVATLDLETIEKCRGLLKQGQQSGVIRKIDAGAKRLYVDERLWRELGPDARKGVAGSAVCDWFGLKIDDSTFDQGVMVVSWQSGDQLSLVANGMYVDNMN